MKSFIKVELIMPSAVGLGEEAMALWRPAIFEWVGVEADALKQRIVQRLSGGGSGKATRPGERPPSVPGEAPAKQSGDYARSFEADSKMYKRSLQGRVGTPLWKTQGASLELGNTRMKPRPHVWPAFVQWRANIIRQLAAQEHAGQ